MLKKLKAWCRKLAIAATCDYKAARAERECQCGCDAWDERDAYQGE